MGLCHLDKVVISTEAQRNGEICLAIGDYNRSLPASAGRHTMVEMTILAGNDGINKK